MEGGDQERIVSMAVRHAPDRPAPWKVHSWRSVPKLSLTGTPARVACCVDRPRPPHAQVRPGFNLPPGDTIPEASGNGKLAGFRRKPLDTGRDAPSNSKNGYQSFPVGNRSKPDGKPCLPPEN